MEVWRDCYTKSSRQKKFAHALSRKYDNGRDDETAIHCVSAMDVGRFQTAFPRCLDREGCKEGSIAGCKHNTGVLEI